MHIHIHGRGRIRVSDDWNSALADIKRLELDNSWALTGTKDAPTLEPSINCANCWHGYITNGVFLKTDRATKEPTQ